MCGDAETRGESDLDVRKVWSTINALCGIMIVAGNKKMYLCGGVGGELVAVVSDVVGLCVMCDVVASGSMECVLEGVK